MAVKASREPIAGTVIAPHAVVTPPPNLPSWRADSFRTRARLTRHLDVDAVIAGGGLAALTAAHLLTASGARVAVLAPGRLIGEHADHALARVTTVLDQRPHLLSQRLGDVDAAVISAALRAAFRQFEHIISSEGIACDWQRVPAWLHAPVDASADLAARERTTLWRDADLAKRWGMEATFEATVPVIGGPGVRFAMQAVFQPARYLRALVEVLERRGVPLVEHAELVPTNDPLRFECQGYTVRGQRFILMAPSSLERLSNHVLPDSVLAALVPQTLLSARGWMPGAHLDTALFRDTSVPSRHVRVESVEGGSVVVLEELRANGTGKWPTSAASSTQQAWLSRLSPSAAFKQHASMPLMSTVDGLPMMGSIGPRRWLAAGFGMQPMAFGMLAAMLVRDAMAGVAAPWSRVVAPDRASLRRVADVTAPVIQSRAG